MEDKTPGDIQITTKEEITSGNTRRNTGLAAAFLTMLLLIIGIAVFGVSKIQDSKKSESSPTEKYESLANATIVYGYWTNQSSVITAMDLSSGKEAVLATLDRDIKHIRIVNNHEILFVKDTDEHDYGKTLVLRNIEKNEETTIIAADANFGIDDYAVSPSGEYVAVWMVGIDSQNQFSGSPSRVYAVSVGKKESHLIYDEVTTSANPVHYPIAITDKGQLFTDRFVPNSGAGWAYGMSSSDFEGKTKTDIPSMKNGTYSTQPTVSYDGKYLGFAGYSGSDGTTLVDGYRKALTAPNTIELLNLESLERTKVTTGLANPLFASVFWDSITNNLFFKTIQKQADTVLSSTYSYSSRLEAVTRMTEIPQLDFFANFEGGKYLMGQKFQGDSGVGNLGPKYSQSVNKFYVVNESNLTQKALTISHEPLQLIAIKPSTYFPIVEKSSNVDGKAVQQIRLQTFEIKPSLAPKRSSQQSEPVPVPESPDPVDLPLCRTISYPQCNQLLGTNYPISKDIGDINDKAFSDCVWGVQQQGEASSTCLDSPLYLYGMAGDRVKVRIDTSVTSPNVSIQDNIISAVLGEGGSIVVGGRSVEGITFDYSSKIKNVSQPVDGWVFSHSEKIEKMEKMAFEFGLNKKETDDLVLHVKKIKSPYLFVSFFDHKTSHGILPLYFEPTPTTYRNIVFYFKKLAKMSTHPSKTPIIHPIERIGLTAIEVSYMTE